MFLGHLLETNSIDRRTMGPSLAGYRLRAYTHPSAGYSPDSDRYTDYNKVCTCFALICFYIGKKFSHISCLLF